MATVSWQFGPSSFYVKVSAQDGTSSELSGDKGVDEMSLSFMTSPPPVATSFMTTLHVATGAASTGAPPPLITTPIITAPLVPGTVIIDVAPVDITASFSFAADDGFIDAYWTVSRDGLRGKGAGKGLGKSTTVVQTPP